MKRPRDESLDESGTAHREKREKFSVEDCEVQLRAALPDQFLFHPSNTKDLEVG